eukprot:3937138-Rhodomonas_salina.2
MRHRAVCVQSVPGMRVLAFDFGRKRDLEVDDDAVFEDDGLVQRLVQPHLTRKRVCVRAAAVSLLLGCARLRAVRSQPLAHAPPYTTQPGLGVVLEAVCCYDMLGTGDSFGGLVCILPRPLALALHVAHHAESAVQSGTWY